ncbi:SNF2 family N-terminal domain-containing protein [Xylariaceae sp. FL0255]|nr:SNF2 family N-terminal domain-containing protein [Xylariaceae sp. FL0255]
MVASASSVLSTRLPLVGTQGATNSQLPFPSDLLSGLRKLSKLAPTPTNGDTLTNPHGIHEGGAEPSTKRRRLQQLEAIPLINESFSVSRPGTLPFQDGSIICQDVGHSLKLCLASKDDTVSISSKSGAPCGKFHADIYHDLGFSAPMKTAFSILSRRTEDKTKEGAIWLDATISLHQKEGTVRMTLDLRVNWNVSSGPSRNHYQRETSRQLLKLFSTTDPETTSTPLLPQQFYEAAFIPEAEDFTDLTSVSIPGLETTLYPFQTRALQWLLMREGVKHDSESSAGSLQLKQCPPSSASLLPFSFRESEDINNQKFYISDLYHIVTRDITPFQKVENEFRGGFLAEEMGLGKTVEVISLILSHTRNPSYLVDLDFESRERVLFPSKATLIVTPSTLVNQWLSELERHAPSLVVMVYQGVSAWRDQWSGDHTTGQRIEPALLSQLAKCDVVLTSYTVLQAEIHFAENPPDRSMRYPPQRERIRSPLVRIEWWRLCLDEAQQVDSGVSNAARLACSIPRINAWSVTGTPVKNDIKDLNGLLAFLRYWPFHSSQVIFNDLINSHKDLFTALFKRIAMRHSKRAVRDELQLPAQRRFVVTMPFSTIERHNYKIQFKDLMSKIGFDPTGNPLRDGSDDDMRTISQMRGALASLRQMILHPSITRRAVGAYKTLTEHLEVLIEQSDNRIQIDERSYLAAKIHKGQLLENSPRVGEALDIWKEVLDELRPIVIQRREELQNAIQKSQHSKDGLEGANLDHRSEEASETTRISECRRKLRLILELEHQVTFYIASGCFQLKSDESLTKPGSDEYKDLERRETRGYESAKHLRKEILREPLAKATRSMEKLEESAMSQSFVTISEIVVPNIHGLESLTAVEKLENLGVALNDQANQIDEWREIVVSLLLKPLVDGEEDVELTGEEYEDSTKIQDDLMVYTTALRALICDRQDALSGLVNERIKHETAYAERLAKAGEGHAPEKMLECLALRNSLNPILRERSLRGIHSDLKELATKLRHDVVRGSERANVELNIVTKQLKYAKDLLTEHGKIATDLERELDMFTSAMNNRVEFYRQLQILSDGVIPLDDDIREDLAGSWKSFSEQENLLRKKVSVAKSQHRHLLLIRDEEGQSSDQQRFCVICQSDFTRGILTECGHRYCEPCMRIWWNAKHNCPMCKKRLTASMLLEFTKKQPELKLLQDHGGVSGSRKFGIYSSFDEAKLRNIQNIDLQGRPSYSTKIDTLIRHLLWLREEDPGAKSIIFSQFQSFLDILPGAMAAHRIGYASFTPGANRKAREIQRFKEDPGVECLIMSAKAHASGLNLVNASHVFLCEPLLNTALELQAIARVDRIGQETETTVWLYIIENTIEESIYDLSVRRRMEHMETLEKGKAKETESEVSAMALEAANSHELEQAALDRLMSKHEEGEAVDDQDLWGCLFGDSSMRSKSGVADQIEDMAERYPNSALTRALAAHAAEERKEL